MDIHLPGDDHGDADAPAFQPRRVRRMTITEATKLRSGSSEAVDVTLCDLSTGGFMAECMRPVLIGSFVSIDLPGIGPVNAQVRWQVGRRMGGRFLDPVSLNRCEWLVPGG